jgi:hypothetical protein
VAALNIEAKQIETRAFVQVLHGQGFVETNARFARLLIYPTHPNKACIMSRLRKLSVLLFACWRIAGMQAEEQKQATTAPAIAPQPSDIGKSQEHTPGFQPSVEPCSQV